MSHSVEAGKAWYAFEGNYPEYFSEPFMADEPLPDPARDARAANTTAKVVEFHKLGKRAAAYLKKNPGWQAFKDFAQQEQIGIDTVRKARRFYAEFGAEDLEDFCRLRNAAGMPLGWSHAVQLIRVKDASLRRRLLEQTLEQNLTQIELGELITEQLSERHSAGGRKLKRPASAEALLQQLISETEKWCRRCEQVWTAGQELNLADAADRRGKKQAARLKEQTKRARLALAGMAKAVKQAQAAVGRFERGL